MRWKDFHVGGVIVMGMDKVSGTVGRRGKTYVLWEW